MSEEVIIQRSLDLGEVSVSRLLQADGSLVITNDLLLPEVDGSILDWLDRWSVEKADQVFLRERTGDGWSELSYSGFKHRVEETAAKLLSLNLSCEAPLVTLAPNTINHAVVMFAAMTLGVPVCPVSPAYALMAKKFDRLEAIIGIVKPGAIFVSDPNMFSKVANALADKLGAPFISMAESQNIRSINEMIPGEYNEVIRRRHDVTQDTIAKILMTSGSTGVPKGVINTHKMMMSNQAALAVVWPFLKSEAPNLVDWLPWSHTFGGNVCFNSVLCHGGVLNIDDGKPVPALIGRSVENLGFGKPNIHFNVPAGIEALLPCLEDDAVFAKKFFKNLKVIFVAAAALPQDARNRMLSIAEKFADTAPLILMGWGSTETAPFSTCVYFDTERADNLGLPMPGTEIKMVPQQDKMELCVKGPNVTPGYWHNDAATQKAFDSDGFYKMGDAGKLLDPADPAKGIAFDGRLSENFKLLSGTWVNVGKLRLSMIDVLRPLVNDAVVTGHNCPDIGLLLVPNFKYLSRAFALPDGEYNGHELAARTEIVRIFVDKITDYNARNKSGSTYIKRFAFMPKDPDIDKSEITDKGYLNQRMLLTNYQDFVAGMHSEKADGLVFFSGHEQ